MSSHFRKSFCADRLLGREKKKKRKTSPTQLLFYTQNVMIFMAETFIRRYWGHDRSMMISTRWVVWIINTWVSICGCAVLLGVHSERELKRLMHLFIFLGDTLGFQINVIRNSAFIWCLKSEPPLVCVMQDFSMQKLKASSGIIFLCRWIWVYGKSGALSIFPKYSALKLLTFIAVAVLAICFMLLNTS